MTSAVLTPAAVRRSTALSRFRARPSTVLSLLVVALVVLSAIAPGVLASGTPTQIDLPNALATPSLAHPFGTDEAGRDLLTRVIYGTRLSLGIGLGATGIAMALAVLLGFTAGLLGGFVDTVITRVLEVFFAFPALLAALLVIAVFGPSVTTSIVAVGLGSTPGYARMVRGQVLNAKESGYVESALPSATAGRR